MKKFLKDLLSKRLNNEKGLTLIELLAVIVILAIIAAIAVPAIGNIINDSRDKAILSEAANLLSGAKMAITSNDCGDATGGVITCDGTELNEYFEGDTTGASVSFTTSTSSYDITYPRFADIADKTEFATGLDTATNTMSEANLRANLGE